MIKKILSVLFVLTMIISVFAGLDFTLPTASAVQIIKSGDYEYTVNDNNEITIKNYLGNDREVSIPSEINGMPVTEIGEYSFNGFKRYAENNSGFENHPNEWNNKRIRKISVPSTVRKICDNAFGNMDRLSEVVLVEGLETIEMHAFLNCPKLKKIELPDSLAVFSLSSFEETAVEEAVLGSNTKKLVLDVETESKIKKIICNADEISFGTVQFEGNSALEEIVINGNVRYGFRNKKTPIKRIICNGEVSFYSVLDFKTAGFDFISDAEGYNVVFSKIESDRRTTYDTDSFRYYLNDKNEAVISRYIGGESNVTVPSHLDGHAVTAIAPLAFACMKEGGLFADDRYIAENLLVSVSLPETVRTIGKFAFAKNLSLEEIRIQSGVEMIPSECFFGCESLNGIILPETIKMLGDFAFAKNLSLEEITFPSGVGKIPEGCFSECETLKEIILPETVTEIGDRAFENCKKLERAEMQSVVKTGKSSFGYCKALSDVVYTEKLKEVGSASFCNCNLTGILDLSSVERIGSYAFDGTNITKAVLNDNLEKLESSVFRNCTLLEEVNYPSKLVSIGDSCFSYSGINKAVFSEGLKEIGAFAFHNCKELYILELPHSLEKIGNFAFEKTLVEIVVIHENLELIGYCAFGYCKELEILYFNAKNCMVEFYDNSEVDLDYDDLANASPFLGCNLREIYLGEGITAIGGNVAPYGTFENCSSLESVIIPDTVSEIGTAAFKNCSSLETAVISGSVTEIADDAFDGCDNLTIVCFKESFVYTYAKANGIKVSTFIVAPIPNQTYTGYEIEPDVKVSYSGDDLYKNIDFSVSYANNINAGKADVTVKGKGDYKNFSNKVKFTIVTKNISSATIAAIPEQAFTGSAVTPELIVTDGTKLLCENKDYTAAYTNNKNEGTATVKITGTGNYSGSISTEFQIVNMDGTENFFSILLTEIRLFFAKLESFFAEFFSFK